MAHLIKVLYMQQSIYHVYEIKHKLKYQMNFVNEKSSTLSREFAKLTRAFFNDSLFCFSFETL